MLALNHDAVALATAPHSQPCLTVQAIDALVIGVRAFAFHQGVQSAVAESTTFVRQLHQTRREHLILVVRLRVVMQHAARKARQAGRRGARRC
ncbi:hypothetical protein DO61_4951 [Burkholderia mallei]|nr:hypothetical protein DO61_4951 [Burkholderia mallei]